MAHLLNRLNGADYQRALKRLDARAGETVLELGFGGGIGVRALLKAGVRVIASEPAVDMRSRAHRRFSRALATGQLEVWPHAAEQLPQRDVDRALSMNTVYFWDDIDTGFANLRRMVTRRVVLGIAHPQHLQEVGFAAHGFRTESIDWYAGRLDSAGFRTRIEPAPSPNSAGLLIGEPHDL